VLYIADAGNKRVVTYNPGTGLAGVRVSGNYAPAGIAVDAAGTLYVAYPEAESVTVYQGGGVMISLSAPGVTSPEGVAVDASGSVLVSDLATGDIVRIPNVAGTLTPADAVTVEKNPMAGAGIALDAEGNLYTADPAGKAVYAVHRTAASLNFGRVDDDSSADLPLYVVSSGSTALTLGSPIFAAPTLNMFGLAAGTTNGCNNSSVAAGTVCELTATFAPPNATAANSYAATSALNSNALNAPSATISFSGTAVFENESQQTIAFSQPSTPVTYGVAPITLSATGGASGNPVVFSVISGPAGVSGATLTITGAGTVIVAANQAGNTDYAPAPQVERTIVVNPAELTVTANNLSMSYGSKVPALTYSITGYVNGDGSKSGVVTGAPALGTTATAASPVGNYPITAAPGTLAAANYGFSFAGGSLAVIPALLKVTANNLSMSYGSKVPALTYGITGYVNGDGSKTGVVTGAPTLSTTVTSRAPVWTYLILISPGTLAAANYRFTFVNGMLTVNKATLTVTAHNLSTSYGKIPALTYTITGFVNGDDVYCGAPKLSTAATAASAAGKYPITVAAGTLAADNYSFKPVNATLTINQATLTVTARNLTKKQGTPNPALTYTIAGFVNGDTQGKVSTGRPARPEDDSDDRFTQGDVPDHDYGGHPGA
jgi:hypothetical protein